MPWIVPFIPALISAGTAVYSATQSKNAAQKAVDEQKTIQANLKYEPIDIEKLKSDATKAAIENATQSLALERELTPNVAAQRAATDAAKATAAQQVQAELAMGGNLSPDVVNRVTQAGRIIGAQSGIGIGSTVPLTAALLGTTAMDVAARRRAEANGLQGPGESPTVGLSPGGVAAVEVAQNAAYNDFNAAKAGIDSNLAKSESIARTAQIGGQTGMASSLANLLGQGIGAYAGASNGSKVSPSIDYLGNSTTMTPYIVRG